MKFIFLRIAWMKWYRGLNINPSHEDIPSGGGSYVDMNNDGNEIYNFKPYRGNVYGYVMIQKQRKRKPVSIRIERIGANKEDKSIDRVTTVFFAKNPETGGQYIVGWYRNSKLFRYEQTINLNRQYRVIADRKDSHLISEEDRVFKMPKDGPGESNVWYAEDHLAFQKKVNDYIANLQSYILKGLKRKNNFAPWQKDIELRKKVENAAMDFVTDYFEKRKYKISYRHTEKLGWDLEAKNENSTLLLEVKGLSGNFNAIELTPNEYSKAKRYKKKYRICIVSNALNEKKRILDIYFYLMNKWVNKENKTLSKQEMISVRFS